VQAAAQRFGVKPADCRTENGVVIAGNHRARYGELAAAAAKLPPLEAVTLKDPKDWKLIGKPTKRLDTPEKTTGRAQFGIDVRFPGLLTAVVARAPVFGATVKSFDAGAARAVPGSARWSRCRQAWPWWPITFGGEARPRCHSRSTGTWAPTRASTVPRYGSNSANLPPPPERWRPRPAMRATGSAGRSRPSRPNTPCVSRARADGAGELHGAARTGNCEIWAGTQFQGMDQQIAARITGLKPEQVDIHTTFLGGRIRPARQLHVRFRAEAVEVAKAAKAPVKTVWTREDDVRGGYYRSAFLHRARISLGADGQPLAWQHTVVGQSILIGTLFEKAAVKNGIDSTRSRAWPIRRISRRSRTIGSSCTRRGPASRSCGGARSGTAIRPSCGDPDRRLAQAADKDPVEYRRALLKNSHAISAS